MKNLLMLAMMILAFSNLNAQANIKFGSYHGSIEVAGELSNVVTKLEIIKDKIKGSYVYGGSSGKLKNCKLEGHTLTCNWSESESSTGNFSAIFNDNYSSFIAVWSYSNGSNGGAWFGTVK